MVLPMLMATPPHSPPSRNDQQIDREGRGEITDTEEESPDQHPENEGESLSPDASDSEHDQGCCDGAEDKATVRQGYLECRTGVDVPDHEGVDDHEATAVEKAHEEKQDHGRSHVR